jgi:hypothetical protein
VATEAATETATEAVTGETSTATASGVVVLPNADGTQRVENTAEGFTLTLPEGWETVDPQAPGVSEAVQERLDSAGFSNVPVNIDALIASGVKLWAFDVEPDTNTDFTTNFTVLPLGAGGSASLDQIEGQAEAQVEQGLGVDIQQRRVTLGDGEALELRYLLDPPAEGVPSLETTQYVFDERRGNYVLTFSTLPETQAAYAPIFEQIATSFELTQ